MAVRPAHTYLRKSPNLLNLISADKPKLATFLHILSHKEAQCPLEGVIVLKSCFVYDAKFVLSSEQEWIASTIADLGAADELKSVLKNVIESSNFGYLEPHQYATFLIAKAGSGNYGHVIAEILPKIVNIKKAGIREARLLLPRDMQRFFPVTYEIFKLLGISLDIRVMNAGELLKADNIHVMSPVSQHDWRKSTTFLEFRDVIFSLYNIAESSSKSILVTRGSQDSRRLSNANQVETIFKEHGFQPVYPGLLEISDQIRLFSTARRIAGTLGAGLSNIGFAPSECDVLMIDPGLGDYFFWDFSCLLQQSFTWLFSGPYQGYQPNLAQQDFFLDQNLLQANLRALYG